MWGQDQHWNMREPGILYRAGGDTPEGARAWQVSVQVGVQLVVRVA
ncbi:hypothetical protein ACFFX1_09260 [Dactylosporangium sucinum]|nr:hypothetical protein [Dactylosporangium sucinum]